MNQTDAAPTLTLKLLPAYAGVESIADALLVPRAARLVWLEILVNEQFDLTVRQDCPVVREASHWPLATDVCGGAVVCHSPLIRLFLRCLNTFGKPTAPLT